MPQSLLETTDNTRELGGIPLANGKFTAFDRVWRSDAPKNPSQADIDKLISHNITTAIDLRGDPESEGAPHGLCGNPGFTYVRAPIPEGAGIPESVAAVADVYDVILSSPSMPIVLHTIASAKGGVIFNCTAGKDRTGCVSMLLLLANGADDEAIVHNYLLSREYLVRRFRIVHEKHPTVDMNIVIPQEVTIRAVLRRFRQKYGSAQNYFASIGLNSKEIQTLSTFLQ